MRHSRDVSRWLPPTTSVVWMERDVLKRGMVLGMLPLMMAACANEPAPKVMGFQATSSAMAQGTRADLTSSTEVGRIETPRRKTLGDKVLTAIALERVTGRKPDPARLVE